MEKIIEALAQYFSPQFRDKLKRSEGLAALIGKLEHKEVCLNEALAKELSKADRQELETKLTVLIAQKNKAIQLLVKNNQPEA